MDEKTLPVQKTIPVVDLSGRFYESIQNKLSLNSKLHIIVLRGDCIGKGNSKSGNE